MDDSPRAQRPTRLGSDFWKFWSGQTISNLGSSFTFFALPLIVFKLTGSAINLAITTAAEFIPYLLFGLVIGAWVDRLDRRRLMIAVDVGRAAAIASIPLLAGSGNLSVLYIYGASFVVATLNIFFDSAQFAAIPNLVDKDDLVAANGRIQASFSGAQVAGPIVAGALVTLFAIEDVLYFDALTFVASAVSLGLISTSFNAPKDQGDAAPSICRDIAEGLRYVLSHPVLRNISLMMAIVNFISSGAYAELVLFAKERLDATDSQTALLFASGSAGITLLGLAAGPLRKRFSFSRVALGALFLNGATIIVLSQLRNVWVALVAWGLAAGLGILFNIQTISLRQAIVPDRMLGRVMSIAGVLAWSAIPLGTFLAGVIIEATGRVDLVYAAMGLSTCLLPLAFSFTALGHADDFIPTEPTKDEEPPLPIAQD